MSRQDNARAAFNTANQAVTMAEMATKDPALLNFFKGVVYYNAATGEMLMHLVERIEELHQKIDRLSTGGKGGNVW